MKKLLDAIRDLLVLLFQNLFSDAGKCFSTCRHVFLTIFQYFFSTKWTNLGQTFDDYDEKGSSSPSSAVIKNLHISDVNLVMNRLGMGVTIMEEGKEDKGYSEEDFLAFFEEVEPSLEEIKETFEVFDVNKDGFIDCAELHRVIRALGFKQDYFGLEDCKRMIKAFDVNGDGLIDFREFVSFMEKSI